MQGARETATGRERKRKEDCIDRLLEQPIDTERQQIALMSHTRLRRLHSRAELGAGGQLISMELKRAS